MTMTCDPTNNPCEHFWQGWESLNATDPPSRQEIAVWDTCPCECCRVIRAVERGMACDPDGVEFERALRDIMEQG